MIISTNITRNKKPAQPAYQMIGPEPAVQNEPKVDSEVVLGDDEDNTQEPAPVAPVENQEPDTEPVSSTEEIEQTNTSEVEEGATETTPDQEQPSEPEPQPIQEPEQPQEEHVEETPKKKASSKKK